MKKNRGVGDEEVCKKQKQNSVVRNRNPSNGGTHRIHFVIQAYARKKKGEISPPIENVNNEAHVFFVSKTKKE